MNKRGIVLICVSGFAAALIPNISGFFHPDNQLIYVTEEAVYDPLCANPVAVRFNLTNSCSTDASVISYIGLSEIYRYNPNFPMKTLFLKINLPDMPNSDLFFDNNITDAKLNLKTSYLVENKSDVEFSIHHMFCKNSSWNMTTTNNELPCISEGYYAKSPSSDFSDSYTATKISEKSIDVRNEVEYALKNNANTFTELIQFNPIPFINPHLDPSLDDCISRSKDNSSMNSCYRPYQLGVYGFAYSDNGARPSLFIQYTSGPSILFRVLLTVGIAATTIIPQIIQDKMKK